jgi:hypothetical protein
MNVMSTQIILNLYNLMHANNLLSVFINVSLVKVILYSNLFNAKISNLVSFLG